MTNKRFAIVAVVFLLLIGGIAAGLYMYGSTSDEEGSTNPIGEGFKSIVGAKCGNDVCDAVEAKLGICDADCPLGGEGTEALNLGMMIHLEGWFGEEDDEEKYMRHVEAARDLADKLEAHNAVGTFEASPETIEASGKWEVNILQELVDRGHAVGVHADVGGNQKESMSVQLMAKQIGDMKKDLEKVVDFEIEHVSGICSHVDWAEAAIMAGFKFTTGLVAYCVTAMDYEDRPDEYKDCKNPGLCHDVYPHELEDRIEPWQVDTAKDWLTQDESGDLTIIMEAGGLYSMNEEFGTGTGDGEIESNDVTVFMEQLDEAIALMDDNSVNTLYVSWSIGSAVRVQSEVIDEWLEAVDEYVQAGIVEWHTINEMYEFYQVNK